MAAALRAVRPGLNAAVPDDAKAWRVPQARRAKASAPVAPDPLATIAQPANAPLPKPLADALTEALAPLHEDETPPFPGGWPPRRQESSAPVSVPDSRRRGGQPSGNDGERFADLLREQSRKPPPQALLDKLSSTDGPSISLLALNQKRESPHTPKIGTKPTESSFAFPPGHHPAPDSAQAHGLPGLKAIQKAMKARAAEARAQAAQQRSVQQASQTQRRTFLQGVGAVTPLAPVDRVQHHQPREPVPTQRLLDEQAVLRESLSDEFDAGTLLDTDEKLSFLRPGVSLDVARRLRRGEWTIQKQIDLHGLRTDEARETLGQFIRESHRAGVRCVRVIHGKGLGSPGKAPVLKTRVQRWLVQKAEVMAFVQANPNQGGDGAVVVLLRPAQR